MRQGPTVLGHVLQKWLLIHGVGGLPKLGLDVGGVEPVELADDGVLVPEELVQGSDRHSGAQRRQARQACRQLERALAHRDVARVDGEAVLERFGHGGRNVADALAWLAAILAVVTVPLHALLLRRRPEDLGLAPDGRCRSFAESAAGTGFAADGAWDGMPGSSR